MLTLGFDSYVEPLRTFLAKVRDASKYDRTMTMGGELTDDLRLQVAQAQVNQTSGPMAQAQVATTVQVPNHKQQVVQFHYLVKQLQLNQLVLLLIRMVLNLMDIQ